MLSLKKGLRVVGALGTLLATASAANAGSVAPPTKSDPRMLSAGRQMLADRQTRFVENKGQWDAPARFFAKGRNVDVWYTDRGLRFDQHFRRHGTGQAVEMTFVGGNAFRPEGRSKLQASFDDLTGKKPITRIHSFGETYAKAVLPGVNLRGYYSQSVPRYDLIVAPGTEPGAIKMAFRGANGLSVASGALKIGTKGGGIFNSKPLAYQMVGGVRRSVNARWAIRDTRTAGFEIGAYDHSKPLVIDPLVFGTYYGGDAGNDEVRAAIGDGTTVIVVGTTNSPDFPALYGPYNNSFNPNGQDAFIARLTNNGASEDYAALIGGRGADVAQYVKIDARNNVWVAGTTSSDGTNVSNFPNSVIVNPAGSRNKSFFVTLFVRLDSPDLGDPPLTPVNLLTGGVYESMVLGLDANTNNPGTKNLTGFDLQPSSGGNSIGFAMSGVTNVALADSIVPNTVATTPAAIAAARLTGHFFESHQSGFILRFNASTETGYFFNVGSYPNQYVEGTRLNETRGVALDQQGNAYLVGTLYAGTPLNVDTSVSGNESFFETTPLVFQGVNNFYVTGRVQKATDTFVRKYSPSGNFRRTNGDTASSTCFSGLLGGGGTDEAGGIATTPRLERIYTGSAVALGPGGDIYLTGTIYQSNDFPATLGAFQSNLTLAANVYVARLDNAGTQIKAATGLAVNSLPVAGAAAQVYSPWNPLTVTPSGIAVDSRGLVFVSGNARPNTISFPAPAGDPNEPTGNTLSSIYFPADATAKAAFITALSVEDQTYESPTGSEFPTTEGFLTALDPTLGTLTAQTYIGGQDDDFCFTPSVDARTNNVFVVGWTDGNRAYYRVNAMATTVKFYIDPNGRQTGLPDGSGTPATDNLLTLPRVKVNSNLNVNARVFDYGYGIWGTSGVTLPSVLTATTDPVPPGLPPPGLNGLFYGRDGFVLKLSAVGTTAPARLGTLTFSPNPVASGGTATGTITLTDVAPLGGTQVTINTTDTSNVTLPSRPIVVTVPAGQRTQTFTVTALNVATTTTVTFTAQTAQVGDAITGTLTIQPLTYTLSLSPTSIVATGSASVVGTITLPNPTASAITFNLTSSPSGVVPAISPVILRPAGQVNSDGRLSDGKTVTFTFIPATLSAGSTGQTITIAATIPTAPLNQLASVTASLTVLPAQAVALSSITASPTRLRGGSGQVVFTVTFAQPLPAATTVTFGFSPLTAFSGPRTYTVPAGSSSFTAPFNANRVSRSVDVNVTASTQTSQVSTVVTILR